MKRLGPFRLPSFAQGRRWPFNFAAAAAVSLVLGVAAAGLWARSYFVEDAFQRTDADRSHGIYTFHGWTLQHSRGRFGVLCQVISFREETPDSGNPTRPPRWDYGTGWIQPPSWLVSNALFNRYGFVWMWQDGEFEPVGGQSINWFPVFIRFPYWPVVLAMAIIPSIWHIRRRRTVRPGNCSKCGYDLRATPDRCPECGNIPETAAGTKPAPDV